MNKIAIIGAGAIGKRHLEAFQGSEDRYKLYVVDSSPEIIAAVKEQYGELVTAGTGYEILPDQVDAAVIATTSAVRRKAFEQLTAHCRISGLIFEKVLFQRKEDYTEVRKLLQEKGIRAWVNCARREYPSYGELRALLDQETHFTFSLTGSRWNLGCNGIHMLDLVQFLSGKEALQIKDTVFLPFIEESKRKGYVEFYGSIMGSCGRCISFSVSCLKDGSLPVTIEIDGAHVRCSIQEAKQKMYVMREENNWLAEERDFPVPYQSQMTQRVVESILSTGTCILPEYEEAMELHLTFLDALTDFLEEHGVEKGLYPIT